MSDILVQKFGGTSVGSVDKIQAVARRIERTLATSPRLVVVVSAMSGETNRLQALGYEIDSRPAPREMDVLLASGEQVTIALLSLALQTRGIAARSFLADQICVRTDDHHQRARIEQIDTEALMRALDEGVVPVVAGFQGINAGGDITTLGRGGSDTSAVALSAALQAAECHICTDVDGVYTADPRIVANASRLESVTFEEMLELASLGLQGPPLAIRGVCRKVRRAPARAVDL